MDTLLYYYTKIQHWYFLKDLLQCGIWLLITELFVLCDIKIYWSISHFESSFIHAWFCNTGYFIMHWFQKYWFLWIIITFQMLIKFTIQYKKKSHLLIAPPIRKVFTGKLSDHSDRQKFSKILIYAWKLNFIIGKKCYQLLSFKCALCSVLRKCLPNNQNWITHIVQQTNSQGAFMIPTHGVRVLHDSLSFSVGKVYDLLPAKRIQ